MGFNQQNGGFNGIYPLLMTNSLLLKLAIEIVDLSMNSMVMFHGYVSLPGSEVTQKSSKLQFPLLGDSNFDLLCGSRFCLDEFGGSNGGYPLVMSK